MKTLLGALLVTTFIFATAAAQQKNDQQQPTQPVAPAKRNWIEMMMLSQPQQPAPTDDKTEAELAGKQRPVVVKLSIGIVVIEGAVYTNVGDVLIPWPGGGASGCFDPTGVETAARIERANAEWAKRTKK